MKQSTKEQLKVINTVIGIFLVLSCAGLYVIYDLKKKNNAPVPLEDAVQIGLKLAIYPKELQDSFHKFMEDEQLSFIEYKYLKLMMEKYQSSIKDAPKVPQNKPEPQTELEKAKENLAAFDRIGGGIFEGEQKELIRKALVEKVEELSQSSN